MARRLRPAEAGRPAALLRLRVLAALVIVGIALGDWQIIEMQRRAAVRDFATATTNLANGMFAQTARSLEAVDAALRAIQDAVAAGGAEGVAAGGAEGVAAGGADGVTAGGAEAGLRARLRGIPLFDLVYERYRRLTGVDGLAVLDAAGRVVSSTQGWPAPAQDLSDQPPFRHFVAAFDAAPFLDAPRLDPASGVWTVVFARGLRDGRGAFAGVVIARLSLSALVDFYRTAMPPRRTVLIARRDGTMLVRYPDTAPAIGQKIPEDLPWYRVLAAGGGVFRSARSADGPPILAVMRPHPTLPFVVVVTVAESIVLADWSIQRTWLIAGAILAGALALLLIRLFAVQIARLDAARSQLAAALANITQGLCFFGADARLILCNDRFGEIFALPQAATRPGAKLGALGGAVGAHLTALAAAGGDTTPRHAVIDLPDGRAIVVQLQRLADGGWVATQEDITDRRAAEQRIAFLARHDTLTGLPNRALLMERIGHAMVARGRGAGFALLFLDLDRFKAVNDTLGHAAGDELLRAVADRLRAEVREEDTVARLGGDEFVVLQCGVPLQGQAAVLAERIIAAVGAPYTIAGQEVSIGVSVGIDLRAGNQAGPDEVLRRADLALYAAKAGGRGRFCFFEPSMDQTVQSRQALEADLRQALARGEFQLLYQPVVDGRFLRVRGFEALTCWRHPRHGLLGLEEFRAAAEACDLLVPIGDWAIETACRDAAAWPDEVALALALSPAQLRAANLAPRVATALRDHGLAAGRLELGVSEDVLAAGDARTLDVLHDLRERGAAIVLDAFGAGAASLGCLRRFPFERVKIDAAITAELIQRREAVYIVRAIAGLCADLGIRSTAEGVRTREQLAILLAEGCTDLAGPLFAPPAPAEQLAALLGVRLAVQEARDHAAGRAIDHAAPEARIAGPLMES
jgi:diguanylate cyclase (GGDEF)-like protein